MKLDVEAGIMFANTDFSPVKYDFKNLTFEKFKQDKKKMFQAIINDLRPDYLNIGSEPDTGYALTGLKELLDPARFTEFVTYVLDGLDRGTTRIVAGIGSWGNMAYIGALADTSIDALDVHIYPVVGKCLSQAIEIADIAAQHGKGVVLDECWLYKETVLNASGVAVGPEIFKRDNFSFWEPLDKQFLADMALYAKVCRVEYVSPFWSNFFFGNLDYTPELGNLPYMSVVAQSNTLVSQNVLAGKYSRLGDHYRSLIAECGKR
jgi:hypothetical protein